VAVQDELDRAGAGVLVNALLVGSPTVGDAAWAAAYNVKVNSRRAFFKNDMIAQLPCEASAGALCSLVPCCMHDATMWQLGREKACWVGGSAGRVNPAVGDGGAPDQ
jgi:hypothetical protein